MTQEELAKAKALNEKINALDELSQNNFWVAAETADHIGFSFLVRHRNNLFQATITADGTIIINDRVDLPKSPELRKLLKDFIDLLKASIVLELVETDKKFSAL